MKTFQKLRDNTHSPIENIEEGAEVYTVSKGTFTRKVDGATADRMKKQGWKLISKESVEEAYKDDDDDYKKVSKTIGVTPKHKRDKRANAAKPAAPSKSAAARRKAIERHQELIKNRKKDQYESVSVELEEAAMGPDKLEMLRKAYGSVNKIDPTSPTYKKMEKMIDGMSKDQLKGLALAKIKFLSMMAATKLRYKHDIKLPFSDYWAESVDHNLEQIEELVSVKSTSWRKSDMSYAVAIKKYNPKQVRKGKDGKAELLGVVESVDESLEEGKMKDFHDMVKKGMTAKQIAKKIGFPEKDVADFMKGMKESVDLDEAISVQDIKKLDGKTVSPTQWKTIRMSKDIKKISMLGKTGSKGSTKHGVIFKDTTSVDIFVESTESNTFSSFRESLSERKDSAADLYFDTYSAAVQHAKAQAEKKGFEVVEDDWFTQVTTGKGKPGRGKTTRHTLKLTKNDKPVRKSLAIQVYNRDTNKNTYELNMYIS